MLRVTTQGEIMTNPSPHSSLLTARLNGMWFLCVAIADLHVAAWRMGSDRRYRTTHVGNAAISAGIT